MRQKLEERKKIMIFPTILGKKNGKVSVICKPKQGALLKKHTKKFRTREEALAYVEEPNPFMIMK